MSSEINAVHISGWVFIGLLVLGGLIYGRKIGNWPLGYLLPCNLAGAAFVGLYLLFALTNGQEYPLILATFWGWLVTDMPLEWWIDRKRERGEEPHIIWRMLRFVYGGVLGTCFIIYFFIGVGVMVIFFLLALSPVLGWTPTVPELLEEIVELLKK